MIIIIIIKEGIWKRLLLPISSNIALSYFFPLESLLPALICSSALQTGPPSNRPPLLIAFYFCRRLGTALSGAERGHPRKGRRSEPVYNPGFVRALFGNPSGERWSGQVGKHFSGGQIYGPKGGKKKNTKEEVVGREGGLGGGFLGLVSVLFFNYGYHDCHYCYFYPPRFPACLHPGSDKGGDPQVRAAGPPPLGQQGEIARLSRY